MNSPGYVGNAVTFVIETIFGLYILIVMLRFLLQLVRADFYNPVSQFIVRATQPPLKLLRRAVPGVAGVDLSSVVLMLGLQILELWLILLFLGRDPTLAGIMVLAIARLLELLIYVFMFSIIALVILSWIQPQTYNPVFGLLNSLSAPVMRPARRMLPPMGGLDLSPILVFLFLGVILRLLVAPLEHLGARLLL
jgi:YggT family protein